MKIVKNNWIAKLIRLLNFDAIVIGGICYTSIDIEKYPKLMKHEAKHVGQQQKEGLLFYVKYVWFSFSRGYIDNPYEIEAREAENK